MDRISPSDREVLSCIMSIQSRQMLGLNKLHSKIKEDHTDWSISLSRVKHLVRKQVAIDEAKRTLQGALNDLCAPGLCVRDADGVGPRSVAIYAEKPLAAGTKLWSEPPLVLVNGTCDISTWNGEARSRICSYCHDFIFRKQTAKIDTVQTCKDGDGAWCTVKCKRKDYLHTPLRHSVKEQWTEFELMMREKQGNTTGTFSWDQYYSWARILLTALFNQTVTEHLRAFEHLVPSLVDMKLETDEECESIRIMLTSIVDAIADSNGMIDKERIAAYLTETGFIRGLLLVKLCKVSIPETAGPDGGSLLRITPLAAHSCDPNAEILVTRRQDPIKVIAKRAIDAGEVITLNYLGEFTAPERVARLREEYNFECQCKRCTTEAAGLIYDRDAIELAEAEAEAARAQLAAKPRRKSVRFNDEVTICV
ncbi:hypothetical protein CANCADRAFT_2092 [Tortispora caseinolytica NRRL Y-17796]|uniref:Histone-lysine N-methyltransferase SET5 n=1 Tax=Tortispora caseinolytica NRRL Y-17796 TaxID=767744 RepID=A0A1E4TF29_9ASCO|nr:hypothetical protein CANCADRAFT_2092 [Tortispora caseinolytica NRRL Y-17796]